MVSAWHGILDLGQIEGGWDGLHMGWEWQGHMETIKEGKGTRNSACMAFRYGTTVPAGLSGIALQ